MENSRDTVLDPLTGLSHRNALFVTAERLLAEAQGAGGVVGVVYIDVDGMKPFNDIRGLTAGDSLLVQLAQVVQSHLGDKASAGRIGGDEFLVIVPAATEGNVLTQAENIRRAAEEVTVTDGTGEGSPWEAPPVSLTLGVSFYPRHGTDLRSLVVVADEANLRGKQAGKNLVVPWAPHYEHLTGEGCGGHQS